MDRNPPTPVCKSFLLCRRIIVDQFTQESILLGPTHQIFAPAYPTMVQLSVFARCTSVHGSYLLELQLQDLEANILWRHDFDPPFESQDPLAIAVLTLKDLVIYVPKAGKYEMVLLANGAEVIRDPFFAELGHQPRI